AGRRVKRRMGERRGPRRPARRHTMPRNASLAGSADTMEPGTGRVAEAVLPEVAIGCARGVTDVTETWRSTCIEVPVSGESRPVCSHAAAMRLCGHARTLIRSDDVM